jgi:hypothetical protein
MSKNRVFLLDYKRNVTCRPISRQRPNCAHATMEGVLEEVFSLWSAPCPVLGNGPIYTHSDNRRGVLYMILAKQYW